MKKTLRVAAVLFLLLIFSSCTSSYFSTSITIPKTFIFDFSPYKSLYFQDFKSSFEGIEIDPREAVRTLFTRELPLYLEREINLLPTAEESTLQTGETEESEAENPENEKLSSPLIPGALIITGEMKIEVLQRSRIREVRESLGKKRNVLVQTENWSMNCRIAFFDSEKQEEVFSASFNEGYQNENNMSADFSFNLLLDRVAERLLSQLVRSRRIQERTILNR